LEQEIQAVEMGREGLVIAKMNSLVDKDLIDKLYEASQAGVKIKLVIRGICSLVPGVENLSENIEVKSIIGEFLEHSRIYYFKNDENKMYLSSADWMTRNLSRRVELMYPILDDVISERILKTLNLYLADNTKSWCLDHKGKYHKIEAKKKKVFAHEILKSLKYDNNVEFMKKLEESM
jgi:polyphosphate kinase